MNAASATPATVDRLYAIDGGRAVAPDRSIYTPGETSGRPITLPCNACLVRHRGAWVMWDTGIEDAVASTPGGRIIAHGLRGIVARPVRDQLAAIGLVPEDVGRVVLSHGHFDHVGNARLFAHATWHLQRREHDAMFGPDWRRYGYVPGLHEPLRSARVELMDGDADLFGDGAMTVLSTPGHTPGHCSLLVRLPGTRPVLLAADVAHSLYNLAHRCVPRMNSDPDQSRRSMERIEQVARDEGARLWLNHDGVQTAAIPHAPASFA